MIKIGLSRRAYSKNNFFSKSPLIYETYLKRVNKFNNSNLNACPDLIQDFIKANRYLQAQNTRYNGNIDVNNKLLQLNLATSNNDLENELWDFMEKHFSKLKSDKSTIKKYLLTQPQPEDTYRLIKLVAENFQCNISKAMLQNDLLKLALNQLLNKKDYYNSFKLIDLTYSSPNFLEFKKGKLFKNVAVLVLTNSLIIGLEGLCLPCISLSMWSFISLGISLTLFWGYMKITLTPHLGRISWRPYNTLLYNFMHQEEILSINKIITHFEEHNEINIKNFHHSEVRKISSLNIFERNEYILELPESNSLVDQSKEVDYETLKLWHYFKQESRKRKMVLNDLPEELNFLEFWLTHGENFEWVEPDQDPAEIIRLDIKHNIKHDLKQNTKQSDQYRH